MARQEKTLEIWPKGYADQDGLVRVTVPLDADNAQEVRKVSPYASLCRVVDHSIERPVEQFSEEYIRMMSQGG